MENCIACGTPTDSIYTLYEVGIGGVENRESRTEYFTEGLSKIRRVHYKIITSLDGLTEHHFGYCKKCLTKDRRFGLKLLVLGAPAFLVPAALLFLYSRDAGSGLLSLPGIAAVVLGFIGMITAFMSVHYIFAGKRSLPYDTKKKDFDDRYLEERNCRVLTPNEYEFYRKNGMKDIKNRTVDYPV
jgi:hypothetical protein